MRLESVKAKESTVSLLPVIKGLVSESEKVRQAFDYVKPDTVAVSISKEELDGLRNLPDDYEPELSRYEEIYADGLSRFGDVSAPPPCYVAALELADHRGIPLVPVDMDERSYTELYVMAVSGGALFRHSTRTWILKRRKFSTESPEEFVRAWDRAVNGMQGFRKIEETRAQTMARGILGACENGAKSLLAVVELERASEVLDIIRNRASEE